MAGYILFFFVALGFAYLTDITSLILLFVLYGLVYAITQSNQKAFVSDLAILKGTAQGFYQFVTGLVAIAGGLAAGFLYNISYQAMFTYIAVVALIAIVLFMFVKEK